MERFTNILNDKAYLRYSCPNGDYFQKLIDKLAEYEDLDDKGLIQREIPYVSDIKTEINGKNILIIILNLIISLTQDNTDFEIKTVLPAYCNKKYLNTDYDGLFWRNEGHTWRYRNNLDIVELVDTYFVMYRKIYYPELKHKNDIFYTENDTWEGPKFLCRYDYLKSREL